MKPLAVMKYCLVLLIGMGCAWGQTTKIQDNGGDEIDLSGPTTLTMTDNGSVPLLLCQTSDGQKILNCAIGEGYTLEDVVEEFMREAREGEQAREKMVRYSEVCAKWGRWHYRKGSETHTKNGGTFAPPDRYRVCVAPKPIYQVELTHTGEPR
jgi:hypothetical protein